MKAVYFTDGSRPYGGFTASYTSSEDAGNGGCYKYTCVITRMAAAPRPLPTSPEPPVFPAEVKAAPAVFRIRQTQPDRKLMQDQNTPKNKRL